MRIAHREVVHAPLGRLVLQPVQQTGLLPVLVHEQHALRRALLAAAEPFEEGWSSQ